jgi:hypothetical protein
LLFGTLAVLALTRCASPSRSSPPKSALGASDSLCGPGAQPLPLGRPLTLLRAPRVNPVSASCLRRDAVSCLFRVELDERSDLRVALSSAGFDGALALFGTPLPRPLADTESAPPALGAELVCVDDTPLGDTQHARLDLSLDPGIYTLAVLAAPGQSGEFELFAEAEPLPALAALCETVPTLPPGIPQRGSIRGAASSFAASCGGRGAGPDQGYALQLEQPERVRMRLQSEFDALLSVRSECEKSESELACAVVGASNQPVLNAELSAGRYYAIVDSAVRGDGGDYVLALETAPVPTARTEEEACAEATELQPNGARLDFDTFYRPSASQSSCGGERAPEAAFSFRLGSAGRVSVHASDFEFDPVFALRRACEYVESELLCVPWERPPGSELTSAEVAALSFDLPAGAYALLVDGQSPGSMGAGSVRLSFEPHPASAVRTSARPH